MPLKNSTEVLLRKKLKKVKSEIYVIVDSFYDYKKNEQKYCLRSSSYSFAKRGYIYRELYESEIVENVR